MNKFLFILSLILSIAITSRGQNVIRGKVVDAANGEPVIGASVIVSRTKTGTVTDNEGRFQLSIKNGQKLRVSYLGKKTCECMARDNVRIELEDDSRDINDVVVVAYGTRQRHDLTGSIASINSESITENPVTSLEQAMEGKLPGVQVTQGGGMPGGAVSVNIRGTSSISAGNEPLYVVDGFPILSQDLSQSSGFQGNPISGIADIDPNDIQSIEVLKDASASALYGSRASNGVVLITTKKGKAGKTKVTLDSYVGFQDIPHTIGKLGAQALTDAYNEARTNYNTSLSLSPDDATYAQPVTRHDANADTDWFSELTRKALQTCHQLAISGGNDRTQIYLSGGYMQQDGVIKNVAYKRYNLRSNISHKINNRIYIDANIALSYAYDRRSTGDGNIYSPWINALNAPSDYPIYNNDGTYASLPGSLYNPLNLIEGQEQENKKYRAIINLKGTLNILPGLNYTLSLNGDYNIMHEYGYFPSTSIQGQGDNGDVSDYRGFSFSQLMEHNFTYSHSWKEVQLNALAGYSYQKTSLDNANVQGINFLSPTLKYLNSAGSITGGSSSLDEYALSSFYSRLDFKILNRYLLEASLRADRSSKFAPNKRTGWFPALSAAWHTSEEPWFPKTRFISDLKLRASIGKTGNQEGIGNYEWQTIYESGSDYNNDPGLTIPSTESNPDLTWEKTTQYDAGFDASLFNHRIDLTFDWYRKNTHDLLLDHSVNALSGYSDRTDNVGSLYNTGIELAITSHNIDSNFKWDTNFAFSWTKNEITGLYDNNDIETGSHNILRVGEPMAAFYLIREEGIYQSKEEILAQKNGQQMWDNGIRPGDVKYYDANDDGTINDDDRVICGSPFPKVFGSLTNSFSYKGFDLNIDLQYSLGAKTYAGWKEGANGLGNLGGNQYGYAIAKEEWDNRWTETHHSNDTPRAVAYGYASENNNLEGTTRFLENADFLRIRNITLGYTFPARLIRSAGISRLRLYATVSNLWTITGYDGFDPQTTLNPTSVTSRGYDNGALPRTRSWIVGLNVAF